MKRSRPLKMVAAVAACSVLVAGAVFVADALAGEGHQHGRTAAAQAGRPLGCCGACGAAAEKPAGPAGPAAQAGKPAGPEGPMCPACQAAGKMCAACQAAALKAGRGHPGWQQARHEHLAAALKAVQAAEKALAAGDHEALAAELAKAKSLLVALQPPTTQPAKAVAKAPGARFANARCPIMGTAIDPANVPPSLTRTFEGQKVAFCCGACPPAWDKLTDEQKAAKLQAAR